MLEAGFLSGLTRLSLEAGSIKHRRDDDLVDRANHAYTTMVLMLCTLVVLGRQFVGKPISCWTPNEFTGAQEEYAESLCWVTTTYFVPPTETTVPTEYEQRERTAIYYYQWIPFVLMLQAALFATPCIVWRLFNWQSRIHIWTIMEITSEAANLQENAETRLENLSYVVRHLEDALAMRHRRRRYQQRHQSPRPTSTVNTNKESTTSQSRHRQQEYYQVRQFSPNLEKSRNRELTLDATREAEGQAISTRHDKTTYISKPSVSAKAVLALEIRPTEVDTKLGRVQVAKEIGHTTREIEESKAIGAYPTAGSTVVETTQGWPSVVPIQTSHRSRVPGPRPCSPRSSSYLAGLYLVSKALYVLNSIGQLLLMARYLGKSSILFGLHLLWDLVQGQLWQYTGAFPRITLCDFDMRRMGSNIHRITLQCVLPVNMFNEKVYIFLWFWTVCITALNVYSFLHWCCRSSFESNRISFIRGLLHDRQAISSTLSCSPGIQNALASQFTSTPPPITVSINLNPTVSPNLATSRCTNNSTSNEGSSDNMETRGPINQFGWIWSWTGQPATLWANRRRVGDRSGGGGTHAGSRIIELSEADKRATVNFTEQVLGQDGVFVLRLVELNVGRPMATQLVEMIWNRYRYATCVMRAQTGSKQGFAVLPATSCPPLPLRQQLKTEETPLPPPRLKTMQKSVEETEVEAIFPMPPPPTPDAYQPESNTHHQQVYLNHRSRHGSQGQTQTSRGGGMGCWLRKAGMIADSLNNSASSRSEYDMEPRLRHRGLEYRHRHHSSARSSYGDRRSDDMRTRNSWDRENF